MATIDWNLRSRAHACMKCAAPFDPGAPVRTAVLPFEAPLVAAQIPDVLALLKCKTRSKKAAARPVAPDQN